MGKERRDNAEPTLILIPEGDVRDPDYSSSMGGGGGQDRNNCKILCSNLLKIYIYIPTNIVLVSMVQDPITLALMLQYTVQSSELVRFWPYKYLHTKAFTRKHKHSFAYPSKLHVQRRSGGSRRNRSHLQKSRLITSLRGVSSPTV